MHRLKKHHKIIIGSFSSIIIIFMIISGILLNTVLTKQNLNYNSLNNKISDLQADTQSKFNELTTNILETKNNVKSLNTQVGSIDEQFSELDMELDELKASASADFSGIIEDAIKSVVTIKTDMSQGTGFIIDSEGYIITNYHVMKDAKSAGIFTYDGGTHAVRLIGKNEQMDLALLKIEGNFDELKLDDSDDIEIGEKVIAIGNPLGLQFSVSEGIVSAVNRPGPNNIEAYIQTDAALNPGNSGGPLINKQGEVIGINNFKIGSGENLGFALESNYIEDVVNEISQLALNQALV
ncbi:trypsin-like serine protease [Candidatus Pacearchaeota archaeon]|nr:trypsin-like serine protease [Candidatus Pacearchaeota archaeon]